MSMKHLRVSGLVAALVAVVFGVSCAKNVEISPEEQRNETTFDVKAKTPTAQEVDVVVTHDGSEDYTWYGALSTDLSGSVRDLIDKTASGLAPETELLTGTKRTVTIQDLTPETSYVYVVFGIAQDGTLYGTPATVYFTTKAADVVPEVVDPENVVFNIEVVSVAADNASVVVTHNGDEELTWWAGLCDVEDGAEEAFIKEKAAALEANPAELISGTSRTLHFGPEDTEALAEGTEYKVIAFGFSAFEEAAPAEEGEASGEDESSEEPETVTVYKTYGTPAVAKFTTEVLAHHVVDGWVAKYIGNGTDEYGDYSAFRIAGVTETFSYDVVPVSYVEANFESLEAFLDWDITWFREDSGLEPGDMTFDKDGVYYDNAYKPGEYYILVFGVDDSFNGTGNYAYRKFTVYPEGGEGPAFASYEDFLGKWYMGSVPVEISVKEEGDSYWFDIAGASNAYGNEIPTAIYDDGRLYLQEQRYGEWNNSTYSVMCDDYISGMFRYGSSTYPMYPVNNPVPLQILSVTKMGNGEMVVTPGDYDISGLGAGSFIGIMVHWVIREGEYAGRGNTYGSVNMTDRLTRIPPGYVAAKYEDFIGEWIFGESTMTVAEKENGKTYTVTGLGLDGVNGGIKEAEAVFDAGCFYIVEQQLGTWKNTNASINAQCADYLSGEFSYSGSNYRNYPVNGDPATIFTVFKTEDGEFDVSAGSCGYGDFVNVVPQWIIIEGSNAGRGNFYGRISMPDAIYPVGGGSGEDEPGSQFTENPNWTPSYLGRQTTVTGEIVDGFKVSVKAGSTDKFFFTLWPESYVTGTIEEALAQRAASSLSSFKKASDYAEHIYSAEAVEVYDAVDNGSYYLVVLGLNADETLSGLYAAEPLTIEYTEPEASDAFSKWIGDWNATGKMYTYDSASQSFTLDGPQTDKWSIEPVYNNSVVRIWGLEGFPQSWELGVKATFDESTGDLILASQYIGTYEQDGETLYDYLLAYNGFDFVEAAIDQAIARIHLTADNSAEITAVALSSGATVTDFKINVVNSTGNIFQYSGERYEMPFSISKASSASGVRANGAPRWNASAARREMTQAFASPVSLRRPDNRTFSAEEVRPSKTETSFSIDSASPKVKLVATSDLVFGENYLRIPVFQGKRGKVADRW